MSRTFAISALKERAPFDLSMFYYSWYFEIQKDGKENVFKSDLWQTMMRVYEQILANTDDKNGWKWLKEQFIPSLIWYLPHPNTMKSTSDSDSDPFYSDDSDSDREPRWKRLKRERERMMEEVDQFDSEKEVEEKENDDAMEEVLKRSMFYELLKRVRGESKKQSDLLLKTEIDSIKAAKL
eukprot:868658_1